MPVLFIGHGSPMNAVESNAFTTSLNQAGAEILQCTGGKPKGILVVSAHWFTNGTIVSTADPPETIYDFYGFPQQLYKIKYPAPGAPELARRTAMLLSKLGKDGLQVAVGEDNQWGLDHGAWTVLMHLFPEAEIPVCQISIDFGQPMQYHYNLAKKMKSLRDEGILVVCSGNIVHNLRMYFNAPSSAPYDWAVEFDAIVRDRILERDHASLIHYEKYGKVAKLSVPTEDHYIPLIYALALSEQEEELTFVHEGSEASLSMRSLKIG